MFDGSKQDSTYRQPGGTGRLEIRTVKPDMSINYTDQFGNITHPLIIAGTFEFTFAGTSTSVKLGRFDFRVDNSNFR